MHLPNQIALLEIPRKEILNVSVSTFAADGPVRFHIKDNLLLDIEEYVSVEVRTHERVIEFHSVFSGIMKFAQTLKV